MKTLILAIVAIAALALTSAIIGISIGGPDAAQACAYNNC